MLSKYALAGIKKKKDVKQCSIPNNITKLLLNIPSDFRSLKVIHFGISFSCL